jgi:hypothetical protein
MRDRANGAHLLAGVAADADFRIDEMLFDEFAHALT